MVNPSVSPLERALYQDRTLVRQHAMRRTLWAMTPTVADLAYASAGAKVARSERKRLLKWLSAVPSIQDATAWLEAANAEISSTVTGAGASTRELGKLLPHLGVELVLVAGTTHSATVKAHGRILSDAAFHRQVIRGAPTGSWTSSEYRWEAAQNWLAEAQQDIEPREAAKQIIHRWLERFGPATETDIHWWMGSTRTSVRTALSDGGAVAVTLENGESAWVASTYEPPPAAEPWLALLPGLDPTPMGWKQRDWYLPPELSSSVFDRNGNAGPTVWIDGRIAGGWAQLPTGEIVTDLPDAVASLHSSQLEEAMSRTYAVIAEARVRPRFPSPSHQTLYTKA